MHESQKQQSKPVPQAPDVKSSMPMPPGPELEPEEVATKASFAQEIEKLEAKYGTENVKEALEILKVDDKAIVKRPNLARQVNELSKNLQKINSRPRWQTFKHDGAHKNQVTINSIDEAMSGIACEEQGLLKAPLKRSLSEAEEFIDTANQAWDVKSAHSYAHNGKYIFDAKSFVQSVKKEFSRGENVIVNITNLEANDLTSLYGDLSKELTDSELARTIIIHAKDPSLSKSSTSLINILRR